MGVRHDVAGPAWARASLDAALDALAGADAPYGLGEFHARICQAVSRIAELDRVVLLAEGSGDERPITAAYGYAPELLAELQPTGDELAALAAVARAAPVQLLGAGAPSPLPARYARLGMPVAVCAALTAGGRMIGLALGDRGGQPFRLGHDEIARIGYAGRLAALLLVARSSTAREICVGQRREWIGFCRRIHDHVVQPLIGASMIAHAEHAPSGMEREQLLAGLDGALAELRQLREKHLPSIPAPAEVHGAELIERIHALAQSPGGPPVELRIGDDVRIAERWSPLVEHFVNEALTNARKHAHATAIEVSITVDDAVLVDVLNDGVQRAGGAQRGCGQTLLAAEAVMEGCWTEFRSLEPDRWRARLGLPLEARSA